MAALSEEEVPVGAVIQLPSGKIFRGRNSTRRLGLPWAHAEHMAVNAACDSVLDWRLEGAVLACTLEPCLMCAGLAVLARVERIVYGARDIRFGALGSVTDIRSMEGLNHYPVVTGPVDPDRFGRPLREFFRSVRQPGEPDPGRGS